MRPKKNGLNGKMYQRARVPGDKGGRADKYKVEIVDSICNYIKLGIPNKYAAIRGGISEETFYCWRATFPEFADRLKKARAEFVIVNVARVEKSASKTWQAAAWMLERRCREDFGKQAIELSGLNGKPIELGGSIEHHGALAEHLRADAEAVDAHTALLVRLGVRSPEPGGVRLGDDAPGKRTVEPGALPRGDKPGASKRSGGKNEAARDRDGATTRKK